MKNNTSLQVAENKINQKKNFQIKKSLTFFASSFKIHSLFCSKKVDTKAQLGKVLVLTIYQNT